LVGVFLYAPNFPYQSLFDAARVTKAKSDMTHMLRGNAKLASDSAVDPVVPGGLSQIAEARVKLLRQTQTSVTRPRILVRTMPVKRKSTSSSQEDTAPRDLAGRLKLLRARNNMRQQDLASALGATQSAVAHWENGISKPSSISLVALARLDPDDPDWWLRQSNTDVKVISMGPGTGKTEKLLSTVLQVNLLKDAAAAGTPRAINEKEIEAELLIPKQWAGRSSTITAIRVEGDSMSPILEPGYIVLVDTSDKDPKRLVNQMVAARAEDGVTIKWLRKEKSRGESVYLLVPHHTSIRHPVRIIAEGSDEVSIVGKVVKWIGEPPPTKR
jgi:SOS-response transcriptional repressor LexA